MTTNLKRLSAARAWTLTVGFAAALALALSACGGSPASQSASAYGATGGTPAAKSAPASTPSSAIAGPSGALVALANSKLGRILVDSQGETLYLWQADKGPVSTCTGSCAGVWPPLLTTGKPIAGAGVSPAKLATSKRSDGTTEVTYNGHPLYTFVGDKAPGQTTGEGNQGFGAEWDVLSAAGNKIEVGN